MAEIPIERKSGSKWWLWLLGALLALAVLWFIVSPRATPRTTTTSAAGEVAAPAAAPAAAAGAADSTAAARATPSTAAAPSANVTPGTTTGAPSAGVANYLAWADQARAARDMNLDHDYVATGVVRLSGAIADLAAGDSLGGSTIVQQVGALNTLARRMQADPQALSHADLANAAFTSSAQLLHDVQQRHYPALAGQVAAVRTAAQGIAKHRPLLEQRDAVQRFFTSATEAVRAMANRGA